ncbi:hypothetical protein [Acinetobacter baumannii]|uniref:hypothetical protein n=1 Tax=Acinetobacter baumannii TaxID=470 RepID=UPI00232E9687|nr:hypothetical protein [Acinetobacter baumannii]
MARKSLKEPQLQSWEAVDQTLAQMAVINRDIALEEAACNEQVDKPRKQPNNVLNRYWNELRRMNFNLKNFVITAKMSFCKSKVKS